MRKTILEILESIPEKCPACQDVHPVHLVRYHKEKSSGLGRWCDRTGRLVPEKSLENTGGKAGV